MTKKRMYIVRGSEDGNLGVYSNVKNAYERAITYIKIDEERIVTLKDKPVTYAKVVKALKSFGCMLENNTDSTYVDIEVHWLNNNIQRR